MNWHETLTLVFCYVVLMLLAAIPLLWTSRNRLSLAQSAPRPMPDRIFPLPGIAIFLLGFAILVIPSQIVRQFYPPASIRVESNDGEVKKAAEPTPVDSRELVRTTLWGFPLQLAILAFVQRRFLTPAGYGVEISRSHYRPTYWTWTITVPIVFAVNTLATLACPQGDPHPFMKAFVESPTPIRLAIACQAVIFAPLIEEWFFRGILLRWQQSEATRAQIEHRENFGPEILFVISAFLICMPQKDEAPEMSRIGFLVVTYALMMAISAWKPPARFFSRESIPLVRVIFANAMLFAAVHASVWPSPIPLFFLALSLSWLTIRFQTFWPSFIVHALFNAISTLGLFFG